ncbi:translation initiation factor IF-3 [Roseibium litorale]|uniref:Translation initiation factor IF-3 n=1 Tax=Roseibium litorale TaxID=2803841 RepID=A0ABR9CMX2_9HYPH|nr:translation initiation factor IF-3 [Roseibium litorale]MBD8891999.1 translation initiation factor IF-3 [Roseibium litorale]
MTAVNGSKLIWQLIRISIGFCAAVLTAGLFLAWGYFRAGDPSMDPVGFAAMTGSGLVTASVLGGLAGAPVFCAILAAELLSVRSVIFHAGGAGLIAFGLWSLGASAEYGLRPGTTVVLAAGFMAGLVYWIIAGRSSGCWRQTPGPVA